MSQEKIDPPKPNIEKPKDREAIGEEMRAEIEKLRYNTEALKGDIADGTKFSRQRPDESIHRLASNAQKLIIGASALIGIAAISALVSPEISQKLQEFDQMAQGFTIEHFAVILPTILAVAAATLGPGIFKGIRDERRQKQEEEKRKEK